MIHSAEIVRLKRASDSDISLIAEAASARHGTCVIDNVARLLLDEQMGPAGGNAEVAGYRGDLRRTLELAARWLWLDGRPRAAVGRDLSILWCNPAARRLLVEPSPLVIRNDHLCPAVGAENAGVASFLTRLNSAPERLYVRDAEVDRGILLTAWADTIDGHHIAFIEFALRELPFDAHESGMARAFGLTKAECRVVDALAVMEPPSQIATRLGVSVHTIRTHVRRIYAKLAVRSQMQFMRLTMAYCGG